MKRWHLLVAEVGGPLALVGIVGIVGNRLSLPQQGDAISVLVTTAVVLALYVFIGNSGVISFGQVSFVAIGAFYAGLLTSPSAIRASTLPGLFGFLKTTTIGNIESLVLAAGLGGVGALLVGLVLMRLSGLEAGIATFAVLEIVYNLLNYWDKIGPAALTLPLVPTTTGLLQGTIGCMIVVLIAFGYQHTRSCRLLRATREDPVAAKGIGVSIFRHRLLAFVISGTLGGFSGALLVHSLGSISADQVYLDLTFATLAMLVIGGVGSLWGATVGGIILGIVESVLSNAENGIAFGPLHIQLPNGLSTVIFGALMVIVLILAPRGITGSREFLQTTLTRRLRGRNSRGRAGASPAADLAAGGESRESPAT
ncbi:MAG: branched-chain amino acid ABC transporter permease [Acidimicrobiales bacterium]